MKDKDFDFTLPQASSAKEHAEKLAASIASEVEKMKAPLSSLAPLFVVGKANFELFKRLNYMKPAIPDPGFENKIWCPLGAIYWYEHKDRVYGFGNMLPKDFDLAMYEGLPDKPSRLY